MVGYTSGSSAVIDDGQGGRLVCVNPVDGNLDNMDSLRTKLVVILVALVVIDVLLQLEQADKATITVDLWTDSQSLITAMGTQSTALLWLNKVALGKEFLLVSKICTYMERIPGVKLRWVEVHQQVLNTRERKLNDIAAKLAKL